MLHGSTQGVDGGRVCFDGKSSYSKERYDLFAGSIFCRRQMSASMKRKKKGDCSANYVEFYIKMYVRATKDIIYSHRGYECHSRHGSVGSDELKSKDVLIRVFFRIRHDAKHLVHTIAVSIRHGEGVYVLTPNNLYALALGHGHQSRYLGRRKRKKDHTVNISRTSMKFESNAST